MSQLYGHHAARRQLLETPEGQPVLLTGPSGIGKAAVAAAMAHHFADPIDAMVYRPVRMADTRALADWLRTTPMGTKGKAAALDLDGSVPAVAQALLKTLEEPPRGTWLVLTASEAVPSTVASRVRTLTLRPLSDADTYAVLTQAGVLGEDAQRLTNLAGGRPGFALGYREALGGRARVLTLAAAISRRDWSLVTKVLRGNWDRAAVGAFQLWLADVLNDTTRAYAPGERYGLDVLVPRAHLTAAERALALPVPPALAVSLAARKILN